jgi:hypothetical protein
VNFRPFESVIIQRPHQETPIRKLTAIIALLFVALSITPVVAQPAAAPTAAWQWKEPGNFLGWEPVSFVKTKVADGALLGLTNDFPRLNSPPLSIVASQWIDLEFRIKSTVGGPGLILFSRAGEKRSDSRSVPLSIVGDNQFHTYRVNLSSHPLWKGTIAQILFYPLFKAGAQIEIQSIRFLPKNSGGLLANGGFELNSINSGLPEKWFFQNVNAAVVAGEKSAQAIRMQPKGAAKGQLQSAVFEFPTTGAQQLQFSFQDNPKSQPITCAIAYFDVFHRPLKTQELALKVAPSSPWKTAQSNFTVPELATYGQLSFNLPAASAVTLDNMNLNALPPSPAPWEEGWRANWIKPPDAKALPDASRYYRRAFTVPQASPLTAARIQVTGDDNARFFINGRELPAGENWSNWQKVDIYDLKPFLQDGENVVGVMTTNRPGSEGVLAELNLQYPNGKTIINSDKNWRTFIGDANPGWSTPGFDDSHWDSAQELGIPPILPWNSLPAYSDLGLPKPIKAKLTAFSAPAQAEPGQKIAVQLDFVPQENTTHPTALKLRLTAVERTLSPGFFDFPPIPLNTSKWRKGKPVSLRQTVQLPGYLRSGEYSLSAKLTFAAMVAGSEKTTRRIRLKPLAAVSSPTAKVVYLPGDIPAFEINGKTVPVMHVMTNGVAASGVRKEIIENSRDNNVNLVWLNVDDFDWKPDAPATFAAMDEAVAAVLEANPRAYLVLNVNLDPSRNSGMRKWLELHPDQLIQNSEGSTHVSGYDGKIYTDQTYASFASPVWVRDASQSWRELIRHVRSGPHADRVIGYVPIAGPGAEWWYYGAQKDFIDYSEPFRQAFANWAKAQYHGDLALLNKTWNTQFAGFDAIQLPSKAQRLAAEHGMFLEPGKSGQSIDLTEFLQEVMADDILQFCRIVKEETGGNAICGTYYGYVMHLGRAYFGAQSGHYALSKVLASPDIDFLMSPSPYTDRGLGGASGYMTTIDSIKLHGKLYINQSDVRTFRAVGMTSGKLDTVQDSVSVLQRQFADGVANGAAVQWYDFGAGWIAGDKRLMQAVGKMYQIEKTLQHTPRETMEAPNSIAVITSEKSILYTRIDSNIQDAAVDQAIEQLNRSGVAWDSYLLSDLPRLGNYRYFLFLNCFDITDEQKKFIDENLKKDGKVLVWVNAAGIIQNGDKSTFAQAIYNLQGVSEVTGFTLKQLPDGPLVTRMAASDNPLQRDITDGTMFGNSSIHGTRLAAQDGVALGRFNDSEQTSLAIKKFENWTSVYSAAPTLPAALLRNIARLANVPVVNEAEGDVTYASKNLFAVHSLVGGKRVFRVGEGYRIAKELFFDQSYAVQNGEFHATVPPGGTMLFSLER